MGDRHARSRAKSLARSFLAAFISIVLVAGMVPTAGLADTQAVSDGSAEATDASQEISDLLAAGDYQEGEVMAAVYGDAAETEDWFADTQSQAAADSVEKLMDVTADTYVASTEESLTQIGVQSDSAVSIVLIESDTMTTEEMLYALWDDSRILMVEPNYVQTSSESTGTESASIDDEQLAETVETLAAQSESTSTSTDSGTSESTDANVDTDASASVQSSSTASSTSTATSVQSTGAIADVTDYQWAMDNNNATLNDGQTYEGFDINSPGWDDAGTENACGVVAICDSGIDVTNPDLDDIMMTNMGDYNSAGGDYGYNAADPDSPTDVVDVNGHGTHVAGIVASEWNDFGTSGVANGVKLAAVWVIDENGMLSIASAAKGYDYLSTAIDNGLNLVAINDSWGGDSVSKILSLMVTELGEKGAISIFASGNDGTNNDDNPDSCSVLANNPYAIVVDASSKNGKNAFNFGKTTTDVLAPGASILSTGTSVSTAASKITYLAETDGDPLSKDTFGTGDGAVGIYKSCDETTLAATGRIQTTSDTYYYDGDNTSSLYVDSTELSDFGSLGAYYLRGYYIKIPASSTSGTVMTNFKQLLAIPGQSQMSIVISSVAVEPTDGSGTISWVSCSNPSLIQGMYGLDKKWTSQSMYSNMTLKDNQQIAYDQNGCITIKVSIGSSGTDVPNVYIDCAAAGTKVAPYLYLAGTSMAAPMVTGAAAVAAKAQD